MTKNVPHFDPFSWADLSKASVGFEPLLEKFQNMSQYAPKIPTYPPYNIRKIDENHYVIEIAVAGFGKNEIDLEFQDGVLTVKGNTTSDDKDMGYIFKSIADRAFTRKFELAESVEVKNADMINGMLKIFLERFIPEEKKPRKIEVNDPGGIGT